MPCLSASFCHSVTEVGRSIWEEMFAVGQEAYIRMLGASVVQLILQQRQLLIAVSSAETLAAS